MNPTHICSRRFSQRNTSKPIQGSKALTTSKKKNSKQKNSKQKNSKEKKSKEKKSKRKKSNMKPVVEAEEIVVFSLGSESSFS